jgi:hypothetical protein
VRGARARWWFVPLLLLSVTGCSFDLSLHSQPAGTGATPPACRMVNGQIAGGLVLTAQSVPTAQVLPCLRRLPEGWSAGGFNARKGRTRMWLVVGQGNRKALTVTLRAKCDLTGLSEAQSDIPGTTRFERRTNSGPVLSGTRTYVYPSSCLSYDYSLADASALPLLATAIGTIDRSAVAARVAEDSNGHLRLDPEPGSPT